MIKKPLAIFGAGGLGRELKSWITQLQDYTFIGFFDDHREPQLPVDGAAVLGGIEAIGKYLRTTELNIVIATGDPAIRNSIARELEQYPALKFPVIIHPKAVIDDRSTVHIGDGTVITAGCVLTTNISIGKHVLLNLNTTLGHDCVVGDCCALMPGVNISGSVTIGKNALIGTGACILNNIFVGDNTKVGAGAVVIGDLPANCTAVGVPAKVIAP